MILRNRRVRRRALSAAGVLLIVVAASRIDAQPPAASIPDAAAYTLYQHLFRHEAFLKQKADEKKAKGKKSDSVRNAYKIAAGLTDSEAALLESTSVSCVAAIDRLLDQARPLILTSIASAHPVPVNGSASRPPSPQLVAIQAQRVQTVLSCRNTLHAGFGNQRFAQFEAFLRAKASAQNTSTAPLRPSATPADWSGPLVTGEQR